LETFPILYECFHICDGKYINYYNYNQLKILNNIISYPIGTDMSILAPFSMEVKKALLSLSFTKNENSPESELGAEAIAKKEGLLSPNN